MHVSRTATGVKITSVGQLAPPLDLVTSKFEMLYGIDGHPMRLTIEGQLRGLPLSLQTSFGVTTAITDLVQGASKGTVTHEVSPRTIPGRSCLVCTSRRQSSTNHGRGS